MIKRKVFVGAGLAFTLAAVSACGGNDGGDAITINVATAGDTNMEELQKDEVAERFKKENEGATVNVVGTGPGDSGSIAIFQKLKAEKDAGRETFDIDVAVVHESVMKELIENELIVEWIELSEHKDLITGDNAKMALGQDVEGYVAPLFQSQTAIAFNPDAADAFEDFDSLVDWIENNPNRFGYNGVKNGASGVAFVDAWMYWKSSDSDRDQLMNGPYDEALEATWEQPLKELHALPATITNGNDGTLDMLNRGEIDAGPVWVDMYTSWQAEGRLSPDIDVALPKEGMPGQPMFIVVTSGASDMDAAVAYADTMISEEFQAEVIVGEYNWYPGVDAEAVYPFVSDEMQDRLFGTITPEILDQASLPFPIAEFKAEIENAYSRIQ